MDQNLDEQKVGTTELPVESLFLRRWSPRAFSDKPVDNDALKSIFSAGQWAFSSANEQPWRFIVGRNGDAVWNKILDALMPGNQVWAKGAPVLFASLAKKTFSPGSRFPHAPNHSAQHDLGAASAQIALQATALGLHTHGMAGFDAAKLKSSFSISDDFDAVACWALGYRGDPSSLADPFSQIESLPRDRKPLSEWVFTDWETPAF